MRYKMRQLEMENLAENPEWDFLALEKAHF